MDDPALPPSSIQHTPQFAPPPDGALSPPPAARIAGRQLVLHVALLAATCVTATLAGALFWVGGGEAINSWEELAAHPTVLLSGWPYAVCLLLVLGSHEMGHYLACRYYGIPATLPFFLPAPPPFMLGTFGAVIRIRGVIPDRRALFDIAAAGPLAGFAVALPVLVAGVVTARVIPAVPAGEGAELGSPLLSVLLEHWLHGERTIEVNALLGAGWVGMLVTSLNLFPVGQLDGGHAAYAVSRKLHRVLSLGTIFGLLGLVSYQFHSPTAVPVYLAWLVVALFMRDRHPRLRDEASGLGRARLLVAVILALLFVATFIPVPIGYP